MYPTPPKPINALAAAQKAVTAEHEAGVLAMKQAVGNDGPAPDNLSSAAVLVARLKHERDAARAEAKQHGEAAMKAIKDGNERFLAIHAALAKVVADDPEASESDVMVAVDKLVRRLRFDASEAKLDMICARENVSLALTTLGMTKAPGLENLFISHSPLLTCAEAAAIVQFGDRPAKEGYLRRRGWIFTGNTGWRDPQKTGNLPFDSAVTIQAKRDIAPFKGLGSRDWKGVSQERTEMTKEHRQLLDQIIEQDRIRAKDQQGMMDPRETGSPLAIA